MTQNPPPHPAEPPDDCAALRQRLLEAEAQVRALRGQVRLYAEALDAVPDLVLIKGERSRIAYANRAFRDYYGMGQEQLRDIIDAPFNPPDYTQQYLEDDAYVFRSGQALEIPIEPITRHDGAVRFFSGVKTPLRDERGAVSHIVAVLHDITELQETATSLHTGQTLFRRLVANVPGMVYQFVLYPDGRMALPFVSEGCREIYGLEPEQIRRDASLVIDIIHPDDQADFARSVRDSAASLRPWCWEGRVVLASGEQKWLQGASRPQRQPDGAVVWDGVLMDISLRKQAEEQLQISNRRLTTVLESMPYAFFALDSEWRFTYINRRAEPLIERSIEDLIGKTVWQEFPALRGSGVGAHYRSVMSSGTPVMLEDLFGPLNRWFEIQVHPYEGGLAVFFHDISERKRVESASQEQGALFQLVLDQMSDGVVVADVQGRVLIGNGAAMRMASPKAIAANVFELSLDHGVYMPDQTTPLPLDRLPLVRALRGEDLANVGLFMRHANSPDGMWVTVNAHPLRDTQGRLRGGVIVMRDDTLRRRAEAERARLQQEMIQVQELALRELRAAKAAAEAANQAKTMFLATISHELRTPLSAIIGYSQLLERELPLRLPSQLLPDVRNIYHASQHLLSLINTILDLSRIEAGKMEVRQELFDPAGLVAEVAQIMQPLVDQQGNTLRLDCAPDLPALQTDRTKVRQVLLNLLANAAKFSHRGAIGLEVRAVTVAELPCIQFRVSDDGPGIAPALLPHLFEPFVQDPNLARRSGGTGLGLALSRRLCRLLGGDITVTSVPGEGATFTVYVPLRPPSSASAALQLHVARSQRRP
jgi:PAS domain S-box-containing protein